MYEATGQVVAVVLGAGQGTRMGQPINKILLPINGKPVIVRALEIFEASPLIDETMLVAAAGELEQLAQLAQEAGCRKLRQVVAGGSTRHGSEQCALEALRARIEAGEVEIVLIHDGARPFTTVEDIQRLVEEARQVGGAILASSLQAGEIVLEVDSDQNILQSFEGESIWRAQTPQVFRAADLLDAYDRAAQEHFTGTDTASSLERYGYQVAVVQSSGNNIKITTAHDLLLAERISRDSPRS